MVIKSFGQLITQGNIVIGVLIFLIIVLVQFIVITKGAERVSEVAARFTLDAMPGKQMAIDADLSSGLIDEKEARMRRYKIQKEADFYGAMDGATKIVKGDAIMSLIITLINFVAGLIIGIVQGGGDLATVLNVYSIATIGDGLVSQLPALMISTATGMIVTRSVSDGSLNTDVISQFKAQPRAILSTGVILLLLAVFPGTPTLPLLLVGAALSAAGAVGSRKMEQARSLPAPETKQEETPPPEAAASESDYYKDINNVYSLLTVEPIEMEFGYSLIPLVDENSGGKLISRIVIFRRQYAQDMGFVIPSIRLHDGAALGTNQYIIRIRGEEVARGEVLVDYYLALEPPNPSGQIDGIETIEPAYGIPSRWILPENKEMAEIYGYTVITPLTVMLTHLSETIKKHAYELLDRTETMQLVEHLKQTEPDLVADAIPGRHLLRRPGKDPAEPAEGGHPHPGSGSDSGGHRGRQSQPGHRHRHRTGPRPPGPHHHPPVLRERTAAGGDTGRGGGKAYPLRSDQKRAGRVSGPEPRCDAADHDPGGRAA